MWGGREYVKRPISMTTSFLPPTLVERREKAPLSPWRLSPSRLQVVVNRVSLVVEGQGPWWKA